MSYTVLDSHKHNSVFKYTLAWCTYTHTLRIDTSIRIHIRFSVTAMTRHESVLLSNTRMQTIKERLKTTGTLVPDTPKAVYIIVLLLQTHKQNGIFKLFLSFTFTDRFIFSARVYIYKSLQIIKTLVVISEGQKWNKFILPKYSKQFQTRIYTKKFSQMINKLNK